MAAVTICSDFGTQENKVCHCLHVLSICFAMKWWDWVPWSKFFECWVLSQLFHSLLSSSSRFSLVPLYFLPFSSVQSLSQVWFFTTPWITARQASLSITNSWSSLRLTSIESVMPSSHFILCRPLLVLPTVSPSIRVFSNESTTSHQMAKVLEFQL